MTNCTAKRLLAQTRPNISHCVQTHARIARKLRSVPPAAWRETQ